MKDSVFNKVFNLFILIGMFATVAVLNVVKFQDPSTRILWQIVASIGALTGVVNVVLSAKGSIWSYFFGLIDAVAMTAVTLESSLNNPNPMWGLFFLHAAFILPMQFVGIWQWRARGARSGKAVSPRRLTPSNWVIVGVSLVALSLILYYVLNFVGTRHTDGFNAVILFDTLVVAMSIIAQVLMALAFSEQWYLWIIINILSVALFWFKSKSSDIDAYTVVYMVKYLFYFINSINGLRIWLKLSKEREL